MRRFLFRAVPLALFRNLPIYFSLPKLRNEEGEMTHTLFSRASKPETDVVAAVVGIVARATRHLTADQTVAPTTTTEHAERASSRSGGVVYRA